MDLLKAQRAELTIDDEISEKGTHFVCIYSVYTELCDFQRYKCR